jgi:hypothetical protein
MSTLWMAVFGMARLSGCSLEGAPDDNSRPLIGAADARLLFHA